MCLMQCLGHTLESYSDAPCAQSQPLSLLAVALFPAILTFVPSVHFKARAGRTEPVVNGCLSASYLISSTCDCFAGMRCPARASACPLSVMSSSACSDMRCTLQIWDSLTWLSSWSGPCGGMLSPCYSRRSRERKGEWVIPNKGATPPSRRKLGTDS